MMLEYGVINDRLPHIIADLCEIIAYFEATPVSRGDAEGYIAQQGGEGLFSALAKEVDAEPNERLQRLTEDAFQHLMYRSASFGDWYPFTVDHDVLELKPNFELKHKIYAALLADSRLKMFAPPKRQKYALEFEIICREAAKAMFPGWNVYHFGVGGSDRHLFGNKLKDALQRLAEKTRDTVHPRVSEITIHDTGDGGIDLVAIREWKDTAESLPAYFCQCAAQQENWPEKKFEAHHLTHSKYINFFHAPGSVMFIPLCYRSPDGKWIGPDGYPNVLVDRVRIIELLQQVLESGHKTIEDLVGLLPDPHEAGSFGAEEAA